MPRSRRTSTPRSRGMPALRRQRTNLPKRRRAPPLRRRRMLVSKGHERGKSETLEYY